MTAAAQHYVSLIETTDGADVSIVMRKTFDIGAQGECTIAGDQLPLDDDPDDGEIGFDVSYKGELDFAPFKPRTDLVVFGNAHAPSPTREMTVSVGLPGRNWIKRALVVGDRRCVVGPGASLRFSDPESFESMPLCWTRAYGGVTSYDAPPPPSQSPLDMYRLLRRPGNVYPRNPIGCGYALRGNAEILDGLSLPNLEDPAARLRPETAFPVAPSDWHKQPVPAGFGWVDAGWFPRCTFAGAAPVPDAPDQVEEVRRGYLLEDWKRTRDAEEPNPLFFNGASPGMAVAYLRPGELVELLGMNRSGPILFQLPEPPSSRFAASGTSLEPTWTMHTAIVLAEQRQLLVTWCARARLPKPLHGAFPGVGTDVAETIGLTVAP